MDPVNDKKMKHLQDVPDSCVATNSYLEHRRHYLLSIAVESNSPILGPAKFSKSPPKCAADMTSQQHINPSQTCALNTQNNDLV